MVERELAQVNTFTQTAAKSIALLFGPSKQGEGRRLGAAGSGTEASQDKELVLARKRIAIAVDRLRTIRRRIDDFEHRGDAAGTMADLLRRVEFLMAGHRLASGAAASPDDSSSILMGGSEARMHIDSEPPGSGDPNAGGPRAKTFVHRAPAYFGTLSWEEWHSKRVQRLVVDWLLREGFKKTAYAILDYPAGAADGEAVPETEPARGDRAASTPRRSAPGPVAEAAEGSPRSSASSGSVHSSEHGDTSTDSLMGFPGPDEGRRLLESACLESLCDVSLLSSVRQIENDLGFRCQADSALRWCAANRARLRRVGSRIEFDIRAMEVVLMARAGQPQEDILAYLKSQVLPLIQALAGPAPGASAHAAADAPASGSATLSTILYQDLRHLMLCLVMPMGLFDRLRWPSARFGRPLRSALADVARPVFHHSLDLGWTALLMEAQAPGRAGSDGAEAAARPAWRALALAFSRDAMAFFSPSASGPGAGADPSDPTDADGGHSFLGILLGKENPGLGAAGAGAAGGPGPGPGASGISTSGDYFKMDFGLAAEPLVGMDESDSLEDLVGLGVDPANGASRGRGPAAGAASALADGLHGLAPLPPGLTTEAPELLGAAAVAASAAAAAASAAAAAGWNGSHLVTILQAGAICLLSDECILGTVQDLQALRVERSRAARPGLGSLPHAGGGHAGDGAACSRFGEGSCPICRSDVRSRASFLCRVPLRAPHDQTRLVCRILSQPGDLAIYPAPLATENALGPEELRSALPDISGGVAEAAARPVPGELSGRMVPMSDDNPPMMLPNGCVYSLRAMALQAAASKDRATVFCPRTRQNFKLNQALRVFIT
ncbi:hypothetical protein H696_04838 [Fonticula alba]|uniref:CTLH domain-containing protein n=1 Tax=Fonticula alba TaxID=691883 RepID=A0A058Z362_FONAL|nr:hypothetical protein H696_04838 [Fonticula alba]KCV68546.1 hypothetical protein H696_04838 [Fonticula alba]|eukprot:XP_009496978.1 hypothetical protein H696_04838 [Fonticula alba]